jgi:NADPH:quinone reductase-like Zn-dependent oxidoreductase
MAVKAMASRDMEPHRFLITKLIPYVFTSAPSMPSNKTFLSGQTGIVTGASNGCGLAAAQLFLSLGLSRLVMAVRAAASMTLRRMR